MFLRESIFDVALKITAQQQKFSLQLESIEMWMLKSYFVMMIASSLKDGLKEFLPCSIEGRMKLLLTTEDGPIPLMRPRLD